MTRDRQAGELAMAGGREPLFVVFEAKVALKAVGGGNEHDIVQRVDVHDRAVGNERVELTTEAHQRSLSRVGNGEIEKRLAENIGPVPERDVEQLPLVVLGTDARLADVDTGGVGGGLLTRRQGDWSSGDRDPGAGPIFAVARGPVHQWLVSVGIDNSRVR